MRVDFRTEGFAELEAKLKELSKASGKGALRRAGIKALIPTAEIARGLARRDTGDLADSITVSAKAKGAGGDVGRSEYAEAMRSGAGRAAAVKALRDARREAGAGAAYVELFMGPMVPGSGRKKLAVKAMVNEVGSSRMTAQPYLRPAMDGDRTAIIGRLRVALGEEIDKALARAARRAARRDARGA